MSVSRYLNENLVLFLESETRDGALQELIDLLDKTGKLKDKKAFHKAILEREKIVSTGVGLSVAIPHAKLDGYDDFFIAIGIQKKKGIDWHSLDGTPVRIVFLIGGPENRQTEYLQILSRLTVAIKEPMRRRKLLEAQKPLQIIQLFEGC